MNLIIKIESVAKDDLKFFRKNNKALYIKCFDLIQDILEDPKNWIWKPEQLKHYWENMWSRRIDWKNRVIYNVDIDNESVDFLSFRFHYE